MKVLAGPDNWAYFTKYFAAGLESVEARIFSEGPANVKELLAQLPPGWEPDWVVWWLPEYQRILPDMADCPYPTLLVISDWHVLSDPLIQVASAFDVVATDAEGMALLEKAPEVNAFQAPLFGFLPGFHRRLDNTERDIPVGYVGATAGQYYQRRLRVVAQAIDALPRGQVQLYSGVYGEGYVELLNRFQITLNTTLRGELNMRCFEAMACGSLLFCEDTNREIGLHFKDGEHCVLYNEENLADRLRYYLGRPQELVELAESGYQRVQQFSYQEKGSRLLEMARSHYRPSQRSFKRLSGQQQCRRMCSYQAQTYTPADPGRALELARYSCHLFPEDEYLLNVRACLEARVGDPNLAAQTLQGLSTLGFLPKLSLANIMLQTGRGPEACELLKEALDPDLEFLEVPFFRPFFHPIDAYWELHRDKQEREKSVRWLVYELLTGLQSQNSIQYCREGLKCRPEAPFTWFRLALSKELELAERLAALEKTLELSPFFWPAHFLRLRLQQTPSALEHTTKLIDAVADSDEVRRQLEATLQELSQSEPASVEQFILGIRFRFLPPHQKPHSLYSYELPSNIELLNTEFPARDAELKQLLTPLLGLPRGASLAIAGLLNEAVRRLPPEQAYLALNAGAGFSFLAGILGNPDRICLGTLERTPAYLETASPTHRLHNLQPQEYFRSHHSGLIGLFLDEGPEQTRTLVLAEPFLAPGALILLHDTNQEPIRQAIWEFVKNSPNEYRTILDETTPFPGHATWWSGLLVLEYSRTTSG